MTQATWTSQYGHDFRFHRGSNRAPRRVVSPRRKNNPHPIQDFLIYNRLPMPRDTVVKDKIHRHLAGTDRNAKSAVLPRAPDREKKKQNKGHWFQWPQSPSDNHRIKRPHTCVGIPVDESLVPLQIEKKIPAPKMSFRPPSYVEQAIVRSLSPRRHAQTPGVPGNSYTHYNGYAIPVNYLSALDLQAPNFSYATGQQYPIANYSVYGPPPRDSRPMHKHKSTRSSDKDYVHNHSVFTSTIPQVSGYYIIHPDWVSERASLRRTNSMMALKA